MIAVIFEVEPYPDHKTAYLEIAAELRAELEQVEGFLSIERFQSLTQDNKILSLSFFEDEEAVKRWRLFDQHRTAQKIGRQTLFKNYRLRVATVLRDYGKDDRDQCPYDR